MPATMTPKEYGYVEDLSSQAARCLRNMSSDELHRQEMFESGVMRILELLSDVNCVRAADQARRALKCLQTMNVGELGGHRK